MVALNKLKNSKNFLYLLYLLAQPGKEETENLRKTPPPPLPEIFPLKKIW